jgi:hypothetical protein
LGILEERFLKVNLKQFKAILKRARTTVSFLSQKLFRKKLHFFHFSHLALILKDFFEKKLHLFSDLSEVFYLVR